MKKRGIVAVIILLLIGLDQLVKSYIVQQIPLGEDAFLDSQFR